jgi:hypothetical protein
MPRDPAELERNAVKFWPKELAQQEQTTSILPTLLETQEKFIGVLYLADAAPNAWQEILRHTTGLPGNLFLKHLVVLADIGGERLQRYRKELPTWFPNGQMRYRWRDIDHNYTWQSLNSVSTWTNKTLQIDGSELALGQPLSPVHTDVAMLLLFGGSVVGTVLPDDLLEKACLGSMLGDKPALDQFVRQRYLHVSRITGGATANTMGQLCQQHVRTFLSQRLPHWDWSKHAVPGVSHNDGVTDTAFDLVGCAPSGRCCAIEVSFQVTTNSTIERKAGQAQARQQLLHQQQHRIAYVVDGAGNFQRASALQTICTYSDCTVSFHAAELERLALFLDELNGPKE